jgi:histidine kinase/histidine kinase/DNA gyrase B/HSP90-like ATPase
MNVRRSAAQHWVRYSLDTRTRAAFADLGHTVAVLAFVIVVTALKFTARDFPLEPSADARWQAFSRESIALAAALALSVPLLVAASNLAPVSGLRRYAWLGLSTPLCVLASVKSPLPHLITGVVIVPSQEQQLGALVVLLVMLFEFRHHALATAGALLRSEIDDVKADARLRDDSLRRLQAQIAPHFLFNTLANVRRLAQIDRREAAAMLGDLARYFSATLAHGDDPRATLGEEVRLVDAYLRIHHVRMGRRLAYAIDVPDALAGVPVPSMMLLTLVENAIKHGIDPLVEGGFVRVRAERSADMLCVEVADSGRGLTVSEGQGMGLANIRSRLSMLYGPDATLALEHGQPRGFIARLRLPLGTEPRR